MMLDTNNLNVRFVMTPDGQGTLIGVDRKESPTTGTVQFPAEGRKVGLIKTYNLEELDEIL